MGRLIARVRLRSELAPHEVAELFVLYDRYYAGSSEAIFREDLAWKSHLIELREGDRLSGFSTIAVVPAGPRREDGRAIFSGDTVIDHAFWGEQSLSRAFCAFAGGLKAADPALPLHWLLLTKGYRTYRYLSLFSRRHFPNHAEPTPPAIQARMDAIAGTLFGAAYRPDEGLVRFPASRGHLRAAWGDIRPDLVARPDVRFFLERNPGYRDGDELVCITELAAQNLRSHALAAFEEGCRDARIPAAI